MNDGWIYVKFYNCMICVMYYVNSCTMLPWKNVCSCCWYELVFLCCCDFGWTKYVKSNIFPIKFMLIDVLILNVIFPNVTFQFRGWEEKIRVLIWTSMEKIQRLFLLQGDGHHLNEALVLMCYEALTGVSCLTGRPSWSSNTMVRM